MKTTKTECRLTIEPQLDESGAPCVCWWILPVNDVDNGEPIAGGFCRNEEEARSDARVWLDAHRAEYFVAEGAR